MHRSDHLMIFLLLPSAQPTTDGATDRAGERPCEPPVSFLDGLKTILAVSDLMLHGSERLVRLVRARGVLFRRCKTSDLFFSLGTTSAAELF